MMEAPTIGTILVVDDHVDIREVLSEVLAYEGYRVVAAEHGLEALERLQHGLEPCLILLDLRMPVMNGEQFRSAQLRDPALARIPVIVLSADREARQRGTELGAAGVLEKPVNLDRLLEVIAVHCAN